MPDPFRMIRKVFRFALRRQWSSIQRMRNRAVERVRGKSGLLARIVLSVLDSVRPGYQVLLVGGVLLIGSTWLFLGILQDVLANDPLVQFDQTVYTLMRSLRTGWADDLMVTITELGGGAGTVPVLIAMSLLLAVKRYWRTLGYWLAAVGFAELLVWVLWYTLTRARPNNIYTGVARYSFPSGHIVLSFVVYGFMAFLLARGKPARNKLAITLVAAVLIMLIAFSRLYLGAHWFSDVLASLSLGLAWVSLLGIAYTRNVRKERNEQMPALPVLLAVVTTLALVEVLYVRSHHAEEAARYIYRHRSEIILPGNWKSGDWRNLPLSYSELTGEIDEPFSVQRVGSAGQITGALAAIGWHAPRHWPLRTTLLWLLPARSSENSDLGR